MRDPPAPPGARGRFAPSPTGPLHLGNARTALLAWLAARSRGAALVLRVEDLDGPRVRPGLEARLLEELRWLGLDWDEGPDRGGPRAPYRQSERLGRYRDALDQLRASGALYPCFCSRAEIAAASQAPHGPSDEGPRYPGTCRALSPAEVAARSARRAPAWRLRVAPGAIAFDDGVHGRRAFDVAAETGDFVVARADGVPAYQLAVVVDDAAMGIEEVVRGDDLLPSTARQLLVYRALGLAPPRFAHVPLVLGEDGARLAKRHGALSLGELRERGADPRAVVGLLASLSGLAPAGAQVSPAELVPGFALGRLGTAPVVLRASALDALAP
ncbi:tRNA glutamyl-Q(34) synthetase GluQRS [Anaeromyxobacter diazotrophicus]|uniref:Glutamyl-Q tRNA(Asp) synthetase n=1 Tax=Anaeromyxobacter diazotrophicus TaxID=2590199 RepID=A0A7I9VJ57_9BACT|nr:tRNA glutamyl-Q(34) synthetase GluQRS [Anaeromyxobacter diazotrophicus]GEJ56441.1 glutamyl-Q tRNA(Asp) synthetase [Anaeromyxobacter diazotrophicus]